MDTRNLPSPRPGDGHSPMAGAPSRATAAASAPTSSTLSLSSDTHVRAALLAAGPHGFAFLLASGAFADPDARLEGVPVLALRVLTPGEPDGGVVSAFPGLPASKHGTFIGTERMQPGTEHVVGDQRIRLASPNGFEVDLTSLTTADAGASPIQVIGRHRRCQLQVPAEHTHVGNFHCALVRRENGWAVVDGLVGSDSVQVTSAGTTQRMTSGELLKPMDTVDVGGRSLQIPSIAHFSGYGWAYSSDPEKIPGELNGRSYGAGATTEWRKVQIGGNGGRECLLLGHKADLDVVAKTLQAMRLDQIPDQISQIFVAPIPGTVSLPDDSQEPVLCSHAGDELVLDPAAARAPELLSEVLSAAQRQKSAPMTLGMMYPTLASKHPQRLGPIRDFSLESRKKEITAVPSYKSWNVYRVHDRDRAYEVTCDLTGTKGSQICRELESKVRAQVCASTEVIVEEIFRSIGRYFPHNESAEDEVARSSNLPRSQGSPKIPLEQFLVGGGGSSELQAALFGALVELLMERGLLKEKLKLSHHKPDDNRGDLAWCRVARGDGTVWVAVPCENVFAPLVSRAAHLYRAVADWNFILDLPITESTARLFLD